MEDLFEDLLFTFIYITLFSKIIVNMWKYSCFASQLIQFLSSIRDWKFHLFYLQYPWTLRYVLNCHSKFFFNFKSVRYSWSYVQWFVKNLIERGSNKKLSNTTTPQNRTIEYLDLAFDKISTTNNQIYPPSQLIFGVLFWTFRLMLSQTKPYQT